MQESTEATEGSARHGKDGGARESRSLHFSPALLWPVQTSQKHLSLVTDIPCYQYQHSFNIKSKIEVWIL